jgi:hypothetical protein
MTTHKPKALEPVDRESGRENNHYKSLLIRKEEEEEHDNQLKEE